jgi:hypothetical protein
MPTYKVEVTAYGHLFVEADTPEEAEELADDVLSDTVSSDVVWTDYDFRDELPQEI